MIADAYREAAFDAAPRRLWPALMWRGVLALIQHAEEAMARGDVPARHQALMRAQEIIGWLDASFRDDLMPDAAPAVHAEYRRIQSLLRNANLRNDAETLHRAREGAMAIEGMWTKAAELAGPAVESRWSR
jgi:flagellar biosynthetic protein FliS